MSSDVSVRSPKVVFDILKDPSDSAAGIWSEIIQKSHRPYPISYTAVADQKYQYSNGSIKPIVRRYTYEDVKEIRDAYQKVVMLEKYIKTIDRRARARSNNILYKEGRLLGRRKKSKINTTPSIYITSTGTNQQYSSGSTASHSKTQMKSDHSYSYITPIQSPRSYSDSGSVAGFASGSRSAIVSGSGIHSTTILKSDSPNPRFTQLVNTNNTLAAKKKGLKNLIISIVTFPFMKISPKYEEKFLELLEILNTIFDNIYILTKLKIVKNEKLANFASNQGSKAWFIIILLQIRQQISKLLDVNFQLKNLNFDEEIFQKRKRRVQDMQIYSVTSELVQRKVSRNYIPLTARIPQTNKTNVALKAHKTEKENEALQTYLQLMDNKVTVNIELLSLFNDLACCGIDVFKLKFVPGWVQTMLGFLSALLNIYRMNKNSAE